MKKTIFFIILGVVTVGCIIFGTVKHVGGGLGPLHLMGIYESDDGEAGDVNFDFHWKYDNEEGSDSEFSINQILEKFSSIKIDGTIMDLSIEEGTQFKIESKFNKALLRPSYSVKDGVLEITQQKKKGPRTGSNTCKVVITIPSCTDLSRLNINVNVGDVKIRELTAKEINATVNVGEINIRKADFDELSAETNVGEIDIDTDGKFGEYSINVSTDVGEVSVDHQKFKRHYNSHVSGSKKITANANVGEVSVR